MTPFVVFTSVFQDLLSTFFVVVASHAVDRYLRYNTISDDNNIAHLKNKPAGVF